MYILALDQGTTSSRAILFDKMGKIISVSQKEFTQIYPKPSYIEHDALEIWSTQLGVAAECIAMAGVRSDEVACIGITNQRETTIVWDKESGKPVCNAIVWQCRRTSQRVDEIKQSGYDKIIREKTGLICDAYFSATKLEWILNNVEGARERAEKGELLFGTVDSWLVWRLSGGKTHITDRTNASRTMLYNIHTNEWDNDLLDYFSIPKSMLPSVCASYGRLAVCEANHLGAKIDICGIAGDQQAALFGQGCFHKGDVKNTYGTGCFLLMNTGNEPINSTSGLITTVAATGENEVEYVLEGSVFVAGAAIQWLRDGIRLIESSSQSEKIAASVADSNGVVCVPAFTGMGAPYWNQNARGAVFGITRGTTDAHIVRAVLESLALQSYDVIRAMESDCRVSLTSLRVDGGASANNLLMQLQADLLGCPVYRPDVTESTALGAAMLAMLGYGIYKCREEIRLQKGENSFLPNPSEKTKELLVNWKRAVGASIFWANGGE